MKGVGVSVDAGVRMGVGCRCGCEVETVGSKIFGSGPGPVYKLLDLYPEPDPVV